MLVHSCDPKGLMLEVHEFEAALSYIVGLCI